MVLVLIGQGLHVAGGPGQARVQVFGGLLHLLVDLVLRGGDVVRHLDHLRVVPEVGFRQGHLQLGEAAQLVPQLGDRPVGGDVRDLEEVLVVLPVVLDLLGEALEVEQGQLLLGQRRVDRLELVVHDVDVLVEGDQVVVLHVLVEAELARLHLLAQLVGALVQVVDREFILPSHLLVQLVHELLQVVVGDQRRCLGILVAGGDADQEAVSDRVEAHASERAAHGRRRLPRLELLQCRAEKDGPLVRGEGFGHPGADLPAVQHLEVGVDVDLGVDRRVDDALRCDNGVGALELHRGHRAVHGRLARLVIEVTDGDQEGDGQGDPKPLTQHDVIVPGRPALYEVFLGCRRVLIEVVVRHGREFVCAQNMLSGT